jgi:hypothetical protein
MLDKPDQVECLLTKTVRAGQMTTILIFRETTGGSNGM